MRLKSEKKKISNKYRDSDEEEATPPPQPKKKEKKQKKEPEEPDNSAAFRCMVCGAKFESRSKMFKHIEQLGHAALKKNVGK